MIPKTILRDALARALSQGGDFAEIFCQDRRSNVLVLLDGRLTDAVTGRLHGAGIRVYNGLNSVYVHTNDTSREGLLRAAQKAADAVGAKPEVPDIALVGSIAPNRHAVRALPMDVPGAKKAALLARASAAARGVSAEIAQVSASLRTSETDVLIANSEGLCVEDARVYTRFAVSAVAAGGGENQTGSESPGALMGFELFDGRVDVEARARQAAERAVTMLHAEPCPAGVMPVVIDGGFGGVIFHEACGHSLEAAAVAFGNSEFCGKLGQQIASEKVTAVDDGTIANEWGSLNIDDEGNPTTRLVLIENGILKNYMVDRLNGRRMGLPSTGSGRRQDYTFAPTSRMRNTTIEPGTDDEAEIIASCGDGLYAKVMGGGSVNPVTGEFNFAVSEGYLIRGGRIDRPVRGAMLIGRGAEVLRKIDRVGRNMWMAQGMCGASSGSIPTNVGQPMIRVTDITVGGR
ncbi:MAG: TldD/PmbA family protein [Clostridiales bacterium]|nr:TldD/PmbA family protein [Clostridiales bacterium]